MGQSQRGMMMTTSGGGGEWTALRELSEKASQGEWRQSSLTYLYLITGDEPEPICAMGEYREDGTVDGEFENWRANADFIIAAVRYVREALAAAAPAPAAKWKVELLSAKGNWSDAVSPHFDTWEAAQDRANELAAQSGLGVKFRVVAIPPQDGQGAELLGPPRGGSSSDLAGSSNLKVGVPPGCPKHKELMVLNFYDRPGSPPGNGWVCCSCVKERLAEQEVATAPSSGATGLIARWRQLQKYFWPDAEIPADEDSGNANWANVGQVYRDCADDLETLMAEKAPEAVAGNASAPVGEKRQASEVQHGPSCEFIKDGKGTCGPDCGQPSGVGEPRTKPTNLQAEPPYPNHETVVMAMRVPNWTIHVLTDRCQKDWPHEMKDCAEWAIGREVGEGLREAADEINQCLQIIVTNAGNIVTFNAGELRDEDIHGAALAIEKAVERAKKVTWATLAAPAPKPAPLAQPSCKCSTLDEQAICNACADMLRQQVQRQREINAELVKPAPPAPPEPPRSLAASANWIQNVYEPWRRAAERKPPR